MVGHTPAKFGSHRHGGSGDKSFSRDLVRPHDQKV